MSRSKSKSTGKSKPYIMGLDTEDDGRGNATLFCLVHARGSYWSTNRDSFLNRLLEIGNSVKHEGYSPQIWCTNLEYDLVNTFGVDRINQVSLHFGRSYLVAARWNGIQFFDTVRHVPLSVKSIGELIGLPKLKRDDSVGYCLRDTTITFRFAKELHRVYNSLGVRLRSTLASTAYHLWAEQYFPRKVEAAPEEIRLFARCAYHGGRTEAFALGEFRNVTAIDAASMFPWAMVQGDFPIPWGPVQKCTELADTDLALAEIRSEIEPGPLPFRTVKGGTVYPVGSWSDWYTGEELRYANSLGAVIRIKDGYRFGDRCRPFDGYVREIFALKNKSRGVLRSVYKLLQNSLYGKFGQGGGRIVCTPLERWEKTGKPCESVARVWNGLVLYSVESDPPPWGNNLWAAIVTARARIRLHREICKLSGTGAKIYYCDTDSVFFSGGISNYPEKARQAGDFEKRGTYSDLIIVGKKEYGFHVGNGKWKFHAKGIPESMRGQYLREGHAEFDRPTRLRESTRTGNAPNVWSKREKVRRNPNIKRTRKRSGFLTSCVVRRGKLIER